MRSHNANELRYAGVILAADGGTVLSTARCNLEDLAGRRLEQAQLEAAETTHMILFRAGDAMALPPQGYLTVDTAPGLLFLVDYTRDPRQPRANMWLEVFCHVERVG